MRTLRWSGIAALVAAGIFFSVGEGQEKKPTAAQSATPSDALIHNSLRHVINTGADLFNLESDYLGCYRLFQGSLIAVKPLLKSGTQADIDAALADAEKLTTFADKANRLRETIDQVRDQTKPRSPAIPQPPILKKPVPSASNGEVIRIPPKRVQD